VRTDGAIGTNPTKRPKARSGPTGSTAKPTDKTISWRLPIRSSPIRLPVIGRVPTETSLWRELAAAARTLGLASSIEGELIEIRDAIASIEIESVDLDAAGAKSQPRAASGGKSD